MGTDEADAGPADDQFPRPASVELRRFIAQDNIETHEDVYEIVARESNTFVAGFALYQLPIPLPEQE